MAHSVQCLLNHRVELVEFKFPTRYIIGHEPENAVTLHIRTITFNDKTSKTQSNGKGSCTNVSMTSRSRNMLLHVLRITNTERTRIVKVNSVLLLA